MVEYGKLSKDKADKVLEIFGEMVVLIGCGKPGDKISVEEAIKYAHEQLLTLPEDRWRPKINETVGGLFHAVDTNGDGVILSVDEFAVYYMAIGLSREESKRLFDIIDADKNGEISYEEFMNAADDFYRGTEKTELSKAFFGPLVD